MSSEQTPGARRSPVPDSVIAEAAGRLAAAAATGVTCAPVRDVIGPDDIVAAYRIQERFNALRARGRAVSGRKIGLTSAAVQDQLGVDQPDFGVLFADMEYRDGDVVPMDRLLQPRAEAEIAFVLGADLDEGPLDVDPVPGGRRLRRAPRWRSSTAGSPTGTSPSPTPSPTTPPAACSCSVPGAARSRSSSRPT